MKGAPSSAERMMALSLSAGHDAWYIRMYGCMDQGSVRTEGMERTGPALRPQAARTKEEVAEALLVEAVLGLHHELGVEREGQVDDVFPHHVARQERQRHDVLVVRLAPAARELGAVVPQPRPVRCARLGFGLLIGHHGSIDTHYTDTNTAASYLTSCPAAGARRPPTPQTRTRRSPAASCRWSRPARRRTSPSAVPADPRRSSPCCRRRRRPPRRPAP